MSDGANSGAGQAIVRPNEPLFDVIASFAFLSLLVCYIIESETRIRKRVAFCEFWAWIWKLRNERAKVKGRALPVGVTNAGRPSSVELNPCGNALNAILYLTSSFFISSFLSHSLTRIYVSAEPIFNKIWFFMKINWHVMMKISHF